MSEELNKRINRAVSGLAGNESLFAELGTEMAKTVLDWGIAATRRIVGETDGLDEAAAETATYPRLRAVRQLIRLVNQVVREWPAPGMAARLDQVLGLAAQAYGPGYQPPNPEQRLALESADGSSPAEWIAKLLAALAAPSTPGSEERNVPA